MNSIHEPLDSSIDLTNSSPIIPLPSSNPISLYNYFILCYNHPTNKLIQSPYLSTLPTSRINAFIMKLTPLLPIIFLIITFIPVANILFFALFLLDFLHYKRSLVVHNRNKALIEDPFENMVHSKGLCKALGKVNWFFSIEMKEVTGLVMNPSIVHNLKQREKDNKVSFMIYNEEFKGYYDENIIEWGISARRRVFLAGFLCGISLLVCFLYVFAGLQGFN